ncbi:MAG TPA: hypothetical protein VGS58_00630 [Candidatus Sulfopaludibacter sp.]|nr:hypothetical protein [Candidatus Sulfopaludibacter sp.]
MTIDERLVAVSQSLETLAAMQRRNEKRFEQDAGNIRALARIAEIHERRLSHLEEQQE